MELKNIRYFKDNTLQYGNITIGNSIEKITPLSSTNNDSDILIPTHIDLHCHGGFGYEVMDCDSNMLCELNKKLLSVGTGMYMPTLVGDNYDKIEKVVEQIAIAKEKNIGAEIIGAHIEGTFISKDKCGIINPKFIYPPDIKLIDRLLKYNLKLRFTIAPELPNAIDFIEYATKKGCYISLGHTKANSTISKQAIDKGATIITHIFNAMLPLTHREPNLVGVALTQPVFCEAICDTIHINPQVLKLIYMAKGRDKGIIISDSISAMGLKDGKYTFCNKDIYISNGKAVDKNGVLAGSICNMHTGLLNMVKITGARLEDILPWTSTNPGKALNINNHIISSGEKTSMLLLDKNLNIKKVISFN